MRKTLTFLVLLYIFCSSLIFSSQASPEGLFEQPLLITSAGQSAEVQLAMVLAKKASLSYTLSKTATEKELEGAKTLVLVIGASLKGLGAAGLNINKEKERVESLVRGAEKRGIPILCMHLGGESRRGTLSDELIEALLPSASMALVVKSGNKDGLFTRICGEQGIPLVEVQRTIQATEPLKRAFKLTK